MQYLHSKSTIWNAINIPNPMFRNIFWTKGWSVSVSQGMVPNEKTANKAEGRCLMFRNSIAPIVLMVILLAVCVLRYATPPNPVRKIEATSFTYPPCPEYSEGVTEKVKGGGISYFCKDRDTGLKEGTEYLVLAFDKISQVNWSNGRTTDTKTVARYYMGNGWKQWFEETPNQKMER